MSDTMQFEFSKFADKLGMCLDQLFMSSQGVPENPYEDQDTKLAYDIWIAGWRASSAAKDASIRTLTEALTTIRDSTYKSAVVLRGIADKALNDA